MYILYHNNHNKFPNNKVDSRKNMTMEKADLQRILKDELQRLQELCFEKGRLIEPCVENYADAVYTFSKMGYNVLKHDLVVSKYRKELRKLKHDGGEFYKER